MIAAVNEISNATRIARFTAVDQEETTILCPSANYKTCSSDWKQPKIVFADSNENGSRDDDEPLLIATDPISANLAVSGIAGSLSFFPDGSVSSAATITLCPPSGDVKAASAVLVSLFGRVAIAVDASGNDIKEGLDGSDLSCS